MARHNENLPEFTPELSIVDDAAIVSIGLAQENQITVEFARISVQEQSTHR